MKASFRGDLFGERRATLTHSQPASLEPLKSRIPSLPSGDAFVVSATSTATASLVRGSQVSAPTTTQSGTLFTVGQTKHTSDQNALRQPSIGQRLALADRTEHCHQDSVEVVGTFDALCR